MASEEATRPSTNGGPPVRSVPILHTASAESPNQPSSSAAFGRVCKNCTGTLSLPPNDRQISPLSVCPQPDRVRSVGVHVHRGTAPPLLNSRSDECGVAGDLSKPGVFYVVPTTTSNHFAGNTVVRNRRGTPRRSNAHERLGSRVHSRTLKSARIACGGAQNTRRCAAFTDA
jgi:hypothetical protein